MSLIDNINRERLPQHVAVIMDGNGRWAHLHGKDRSEGHAEGVISVRKIVEASVAVGLKYLTVYTFSSENWNRPEEEINALMTLMVAAIQRETPDLIKNNVRLNVIGDIWRLPEEVNASLAGSIEQTAGCNGLTLTLALSYSARREITEAVRRIVNDVTARQLNYEDIKEDTVSSYLMTANMPDPDLLIRTGGEKRISNFLLWQLSYAELYFSDVYWPAFRENEFYEAILSYQQRERRFGKTSEQINKS